jgi:Transglutaminase-like superfamily/TgpA N-terminal domain
MELKKAMQDATIERLSKIIADPITGDDGSNKGRRLPRRPNVHIHLGLAEGWFSLFLLALVVYSTIWSVEAANWVDHTNILTLTTLIGLTIGVLAAKQRRVPRLFVHALAIGFGLLLAFWQTAGADYNGNITAFTNNIHQWVALALTGGTSSDDSIFLFFITALGFVLAYTSAWLVYRTRKPWLMILANAVVLLINLSNIEDGYIVFLVVFLVASLLLVLRFNLYESASSWKRQGLRCADDLGWEFMQAGALISIGVLIFSWLLPWGYINDAASQIWSADNNPWVQLENTWNRLVSVEGGVNASNHGNFTDTLVLGGNPNLNNDIVFTVKTDDGSQYKQYLGSLSYDTYNGRPGWSVGSTQTFSLPANASAQNSSQDLRAVHQDITVVNPPGEQFAYLFGASQIASTNQTAQLLTNKATGSNIAFLRTNGKLAAGNTYSINSYVSAADIKTLRSIFLPANAPSFTPNPNSADQEPPVTYYDPSILQTYLQLPKNLDPNIKLLAEHLTNKAPTMYDKAVALEAYFQDNYKYDANISLPAGQEAVSWFLFRSNHKGFCNYFSTSMAVMARELGIPARVVEGYTNGKFDVKHNQWVIRGTDAHSWVQIYFAGYGWVNFEPSASFSTFNRPQVSSNSGITPGVPIGPTTGGNRGHVRGPNEPGGGGTGIDSSPAQQQAQLRENVSLALVSFILLMMLGLVFFVIWWRRLYRGYGISAQIYGRICTIANWAGISLKPSQTPYEYMQTLAEAAPGEAITLERLGDIYVRDRWADPTSAEHPRRTGEIAELPTLWKSLQPRLFLHVLRHPHFLRWLPQQLSVLIRKVWPRRHQHELQANDTIISEEEP